MSANLEENKGKVIRCKAAVAWAPNQPLDVTEIEVQPPQPGEVRIKVFSNALCHTDVSYLEGSSSEGAFPCIVGHEATGIVESIGEGVTSVVPGDIVIPCYTPECREYECLFCQSSATNLCPKIRANQGNGLMPDGTTRFSKDGKKIYHFMGCSTFSEYTVIAEISCAKINPAIDVNKGCLLGCGVATGWGAVTNTCKVTPGASVVVFGLGAVGLSVIQGAKAAGASKILAVDTNSSKFEKAKEFGATEFLNPKDLPEGTSVVSHLLGKEKWGYNFTFDCTGNTKVMRDALEISHRGFGESCVIGVAASGHEIQTRSFQLVTGRVWKGTAFGGWKSRTEVPKLVKKVLRGEAPIDGYVTHVYEGLENVNKSIETLHHGDCIRAVIVLANRDPQPVKPKISVYDNIRCFNGWVKRVKHWSNVNNCEMSFSIYLPDQKNRTDPNPPVLYYLSGLTCTDENALVKSGFAKEASQYGLAVVFPDTSCRGVDIEGMKDDWSFGLSASYYVDATTEKWSKNNNMYSYITKELPELVNNFFDVDGTRVSITGHSMGGHGALVAYLRNPDIYRSCSAFAPICNPTAIPWGQKAFEGYLGSVSAGEEYDASLLVKKAKIGHEILIDQGSNDKFYINGSLKPETFAKACAEVKYPLKLRIHPSYDHSYFFVSSFIADHIAYHAKKLGI